MTATASRPLSDADEIGWETSLFGTTCPVASGVAGRPTSTATVEALLDEARGTYERVSARAAYQVVLHGRAVLVDIRPEAQRRAEGEVHADLRPVVVERNVLEWRLDPAGDARLPWVTAQTRVVVLCQEGYASSLAAASLTRMGVAATDVVGGLRAWREAGLPLA